MTDPVHGVPRASARAPGLAGDARAHRWFGARTGVSHVSVLKPKAFQTNQDTHFGNAAEGLDLCPNDYGRGQTQALM